MPRGDKVYTGLEAMEVESIGKPSKLSNDELRMAIKRQEAEMCRLEVRRARMQTRHWKLVSELSKRLEDVPSDVDSMIDERKETMKPGNESRLPSAAMNDAPMPRLKRHGDSRSPDKQSFKLTENAVTRRRSAPERSYNEMNKRRS